MRLEILPLTPIRSINPQTSVNLSRLAPGDRIEAHVIGPSSNGQTLLRVGGTTIISDQQLGAKPGEVLLLEVQNAPQATEASARTRRWLAVRRIEAVHHPRQAPPGPAPSSQPFPALPSAGRHSVSADLFRSLAVIRHGEASPAVQTQLAAAQRMGPAGLINRHRIQNFRKRYLRRITNNFRDKAMRPLRSARLGEPHTVKGALGHSLTESREPEAPPNYRGVFAIASPGEENAAVRVKIKPGQGGRDTAGHKGMLTASLLLDLENTGVIEVHLTLGEDQLWVDFKTATPQMGQKLEAALDGVYASLAALTRKVYCRVRSDQHLTAPERGAEAALCGSKEIDLKI